MRPLFLALLIVVAFPTVAGAQVLDAWTASGWITKTGTDMYEVGVNVWVAHAYWPDQPAPYSYAPLATSLNVGPVPGEVTSVLSGDGVWDHHVYSTLLPEVDFEMAFSPDGGYLSLPYFGHTEYLVYERATRIHPQKLAHE